MQQSSKSKRPDELTTLRKQLKVLSEIVNTRSELKAETIKKESEFSERVKARALQRKEQRERAKEERAWKTQAEEQENLRNEERLNLLKKEINFNKHI